MMNYETMTVTKLEAAERQLCEAIRMHFEQRDPLAIHGLVAAAHQVLADLGKKRGYGGIFRNPQIVRPGRHAEWRRMYAGAEQFLKHADQDPDTTLEFCTYWTFAFLIDSIQIYMFLTKQLLLEFEVFRGWFAKAEPDVFLESPYKSFVDTVYPDADQLDFYRGLLEAARGQRIDIPNQGVGQNRSESVVESKSLNRPEVHEDSHP